MRKHETDMILAVTEPGEELRSYEIAARIKASYGVDMPNQKIGIAICWRLSHLFKKTIYPGKKYTYTRLTPAGGRNF